MPFLNYRGEEAELSRCPVPFEPGRECWQLCPVSRWSRGSGEGLSEGSSMEVLFRKELAFLMGFLQRRGPRLARHGERARGVCPDWGGDAGTRPPGGQQSLCPYGGFSHQILSRRGKEEFLGAVEV